MGEAEQVTRIGSLYRFCLPTQPYPTAVMKVALVALAAFLLMALCSQVLAAPVGMDPTECCFDYAKKQIPRKHVKEYFYTSSRCPKAAVVLITRKSRKICSDPEVEWVKQYVNYLEMKS